MQSKTIKKIDSGESLQLDCLKTEGKQDGENGIVGTIKELGEIVGDTIGPPVGRDGDNVGKKVIVGEAGVGGGVVLFNSLITSISAEHFLFTIPNP